MTVYNIFILVAKVLFILVAFLITIQIFNLITSILNNIDARTNSIKLSDKVRSINRLNARVQSTNAILSLMDTLIANEVTNALKAYARLGENYKSINTADDIEKISSRIFDSIKKEIFIDNDTIITDEYLMKYINEQTTLVFLIETQKLNMTNKDR